MELSIPLLVATFFVALISSTLSGIASGGGGFIMAPWQLLIGFSPVQMVATGSIGGSSMAIASLLAAHRGGIRLDRSPLVALVLMATVSSLLGSHVLPHIKPELFETLIAIATILSLPLFFNRHGRFQVGERTERSRFIGYVVIGLLTVTGSVLFTSTFSLLTALALPFFFGTSTLESASIRRVMALVQMIVLATILHEHIVWNYTLATVTGGMLGSYIGTHIAVNKGEEFARSALLVLAVVSALALLF